MSVTHFVVGTVAVKISRHQMRGDRILVLTVCGHYSASFAFGGDPMFTHEPSYSLARTMDSLLFEFGMNARTPLHLAMREKDLPNLGHDESIFSFAPAGWALAPCIIRISR